MLKVALSLLLAASFGVVAEAYRLVSGGSGMPLLALALALILAFAALVARGSRSRGRCRGVSSLSIEGQGGCEMSLLDGSILPGFL